MLWKNVFLLQLRKIFEQIVSRAFQSFDIKVLTNEHELIDFEMHLTRTGYALKVKIYK